MKQMVQSDDELASKKIKKLNEGDVIRTRNHRTWNPPLCRWSYAPSDEMRFLHLLDHITLVSKKQSFLLLVETTSFSSLGRVSAPHFNFQSQADNTALVMSKKKSSDNTLSEAHNGKRFGTRDRATLLTRFPATLQEYINLFTNTQDEILFKGFVEASGIKVETDKSNQKKPPKFSKRVIVITKYRIAIFKKGMFNKLSVINYYAEGII
jgi:molybdopterin-guanine dinucleotide biosynthesis protein